MSFPLVFDEVILKQLKKAAKDTATKERLTKLLDKLESLGPEAGALIDTKLHLYELKQKHPPLRLYFKHNLKTGEIHVFKFEMKTSAEKQQQTIDRLRSKSKS